MKGEDRCGESCEGCPYIVDCRCLEGYEEECDCDDGVDADDKECNYDE